MFQKSILLGCLIFMLSAGFAHSQGNLDKPWISKIEAYMNGLTSLEAQFNQKNPDGSVWNGTLYMKRPDKFRLEYKRPDELLLISTGIFLIYADRANKEVTQYFLAGTPVELITADVFKISDNSKIILLESVEQENHYYLRITSSGSPEAGSVGLLFAKDPLQLVSWTVIDSQNNATNVSLSGTVEGLDYPAGKFVFIAPRNWVSN